MKLNLKLIIRFSCSSLQRPGRRITDTAAVNLQRKRPGYGRVLNEKQLHTLRTCYAANPRPDAMMKEQLVEMTGLSPRVIRVWFQNKRCKDKKKSMMLNKTSSHHQHQGPGSDDGQVKNVLYSTFFPLIFVFRNRVEGACEHLLNLVTIILYLAVKSKTNGN